MSVPIEEENKLQVSGIPQSEQSLR
jgi:hypothetical protein